MDKFLANLTNPALDPNVGVLSNSEDSVAKANLFITTLISFVFATAGLVLLFIVIKGAYIYMTSGGDKEATQKGSKTITSGLIGLFILFSAYAILDVLETLFAIDLIRINIFALLS